MGYLTKVEGEITVDPPLNHKEVTHLCENNTYTVGDFERRRTLEPVVETVIKETDDGTLMVKWCAVVRPSLEAYKASGLIHEVESLVDMFPAHMYFGYLEGWGEENGDIWRIYVDEEKVVQFVQPELVWPSLGIENRSV